MLEITDHRTPMRTIPDAAHHVLLDKPLEFVDELKTILREWQY
jgi:hypothetical protein